MKYIDADRLRAEVTKERKSIEGLFIEGDNSFYDGQDDASNYVLALIDSLQQEQPEVDLEKEIETSIRLLNGLHTLEDNKSWYKGRYEELKEFARHFYELGASKNK